MRLSIMKKKGQVSSQHECLVGAMFIPESAIAIPDLRARKDTSSMTVNTAGCGANNANRVTYRTVGTMSWRECFLQAAKIGAMVRGCGDPASPPFSLPTDFGLMRRIVCGNVEKMTPNRKE